MLKIRLMRIGGKKRPFYRVVVVEERSKRNGSYIELLGTYNPLTEPKDIKLKQDRIDYWQKLGAQPSVGYLRIIGKAPQRPPRKPKKEKKEAVATTPQSPTEAPKETAAPIPQESSKEEHPKKAEPIKEETKPENEEANSAVEKS